ncbi:hypothetical protein C8J57DRAFT_1255997 [Mycena rebaudengoi]|nr:hypothetical protein C8J57DRAFT_1255997 [Mycena rebaudengoi]
MFGRSTILSPYFWPRSQYWRLQPKKAPSLYCAVKVLSALPNVNPSAILPTQVMLKQQRMPATTQMWTWSLFRCDSTRGKAANLPVKSVTITGEQKKRGAGSASANTVGVVLLALTVIAFIL